MPLFKVDEELCRRHGACALECPVGIIELKGDGSAPSPREGTEGLCINCGHCVAVCPEGALSLATMPSEACPTIDRSMLPSAEAFDLMARSRRSVRAYKPDQLEPEIIEKLIDTVRFAPTGTNTQKTGWTVANGREKTEKLAGMVIEWMEALVKSKHPMAESYSLDRITASWTEGYDGILRGAPALVVAHAPKDYMSGAADCHIAMSTLELAAFSQGLGACWAGFMLMAATLSPPIAKALGVPDDHQPHAAMMLGYPRVLYHRVPVRKEPEITWL